MSRARTAFFVASASALALGLSGCSVIGAFTPHVDSAIYPSAKELKAASTATFGSPSFIPDDAKLVRVDYDTKGAGAILTYASAKHFAPGTCQAAAPIPKPTVLDSWWPIDGLPASGFRCPGGWTAFLIGDQVYASVATT